MQCVYIFIILFYFINLKLTVVINLLLSMLTNTYIVFKFNILTLFYSIYRRE